MQKILIPAVLAVMFMTACSKNNDPVVTPELPVTKKVTFQISRAEHWTSAELDKYQASVELIIAKLDKKTGNPTVLWDTTIALQNLRQYPESIAPASVVKEFSGIMESREWLHVTEKMLIRYDVNVHAYSASGESLPEFIKEKIFQVRL